MLQRGATCCTVLPTAPASRAVCCRCRRTPSCLSLSTPARPYLDDSGMPILGCNVQATDADLVDAHDQRHAALLAQHLHPCGPARVMCMCVCVCVCVCVRQWMRGREKARARGGGREKEMKARQCVRVAACCTSKPRRMRGVGFSKPRRTQGVGFLRHLPWVSCTIDRVHTGHVSCLYNILIKELLFACC